MNKEQLKAHCTQVTPIDDDEDVMYEPNVNVVMLYKDQLVIDIDFDGNYVQTMAGREHVDSDKMTDKKWTKVRVFVEVQE